MYILGRVNSLFLLNSSCSSAVWHCGPLQFNNYSPVITIPEDLHLLQHYCESVRSCGKAHSLGKENQGETRRNRADRRNDSDTKMN